MTRTKASFLGMLDSENIEMYVDSAGKLRARGHVPPEVAEWIRTHRLAIIAELEARR